MCGKGRRNKMKSCCCACGIIAVGCGALLWGKGKGRTWGEGWGRALAFCFFFFFSRAVHRRRRELRRQQRDLCIHAVHSQPPVAGCPWPERARRRKVGLHDCRADPPRRVGFDHRRRSGARRASAFDGGPRRRALLRGPRRQLRAALTHDVGVRARRLAVVAHGQQQAPQPVQPLGALDGVACAETVLCAAAHLDVEAEVLEAAHVVGWRVLPEGLHLDARHLRQRDALDLAPPLVPVGVVQPPLLRIGPQVHVAPDAAAIVVPAREGGEHAATEGLARGGEDAFGLQPEGFPVEVGGNGESGCCLLAGQLHLLALERLVAQAFAGVAEVFCCHVQLVTQVVPHCRQFCDLFLEVTGRDLQSFPQLIHQVCIRVVQVRLLLLKPPHLGRQVKDDPLRS
eukprot:Rhum_TRINITY_DN10762_c0_g1::Rhum_TRINITY_DN10762_c0_g1_i1::g.40077::m.40077